VEFTVYDFEDRKEKRGEPIESPIVNAHGYEWGIWVYPRGEITSSTDFEQISCFLHIQTQCDVTVEYNVRCKELSWKSTPIGYSLTQNKWGYLDLVMRESVLKNYLEEDGSFVIKFDIQVSAKNEHFWYPKELQRQDILVELYHDASSTTSDVVFSVGKTIYQAHTNILALRGKKLYEIANECDNTNDMPIPILSMREEIFKNILEFIYTVKMPEVENEGKATELLVAADRYEVVDLKLYIESIVVDKFLTAGNAASLLILADSHSCALLKEAATNLFVTDPKTVKENAEAWSKITESRRLLEELLDTLMCSNEPVEEAHNFTSKIDQMDVTTLRKDLEEANLELDGSREVLLDRLKTHHHQDHITEK